MTSRRYILLFDYLFGGFTTLACFIGIGVAVVNGNSWWLNDVLGVVVMVMGLVLSVIALDKLNEIEKKELRRRRFGAFLPPGPDE